MSFTDPLTVDDRCALVLYQGEPEGDMLVMESSLLLSGGPPRDSRGLPTRLVGRVHSVVEPDGWGPNMRPRPGCTVPTHYFVVWDGCEIAAGGYQRAELWRLSDAPAPT